MKKFIGVNEYYDYVWAELEEDGTIMCFSGGRSYLDAYTEKLEISDCFSDHDQNINGQRLKSGEKIPDDFKINWGEVEEDLIEDIKNDWIEPCGSILCEDCGEVEVYSDSLSYPDCPIKIRNHGSYCEAICLDCIEENPEENATILVEKTSDIFKAPNSVDVDFGELEEIETLFCDSSGLGHEREPAMTQKAVEMKVAELLKEHGEIRAALTGIGQFQVYVTIFKPSNKKAV